MIDIHTHLIPFVDDGAKNMEEAIGNVKRLVSQGVTMAFCTPHYQLKSTFVHDATIIKDSFFQLQEEITKQAIDIKLFLGSEIYYHRHLLDDLKAGKILTLGGTNTILMEFSMTEPIEEVNEILYSLRISGYQVIVAHPERYEYMRSMSDYQELKQEGAKLQVNASSLLGNHGKHAKKWAWLLLDSGMVDYIASDTHSGRPNDYLEARKLVLKKYGENIERSLFVHNPMKLVVASRASNQ